MGLRAAHGKTDEYTEKVADSLHYRLEAPKIEFPLFINKTRRLHAQESLLSL